MSEVEIDLLTGSVFGESGEGFFWICLFKLIFNLTTADFVSLCLSLRKIWTIFMMKDDFPSFDFVSTNFFSCLLTFQKFCNTTYFSFEKFSFVLKWFSLLLC